MQGDKDVTLRRLAVGATAGIPHGAHTPSNNVLDCSIVQKKKKKFSDVTGSHVTSLV